MIVNLRFIGAYFYDISEIIIKQFAVKLSVEE